jgi:hypothetical protein
MVARSEGRLPVDWPSALGAVAVLTAIGLINLIPGVHIPDSDEWHGY